MTRLEEQIKSELKEVRRLIQGADWIILDSIGMYCDSYRATFMDKDDPLGGDQFLFNSRGWKKLYKKLDKEDKKTVDWIINDNGWKIK